MPRKKKLKTILRTLHYQVGLISAFFLVLLAITGFLLNHSRDFGLHEVDMSFEVIMWWYGIPEPIFNLERIIIDLHSGRFFGMPGWLFMDLTALAILFFVGTGIYLWYKKQK